MLVAKEIDPPGVPELASEKTEWNCGLISTEGHQGLEEFTDVTITQLFN